MSTKLKRPEPPSNKLSDPQEYAKQLQHAHRLVSARRPISLDRSSQAAAVATRLGTLQPNNRMMPTNATRKLKLRSSKGIRAAARPHPHPGTPNFPHHRGSLRPRWAMNRSGTGASTTFEDGDT